MKKSLIKWIILIIFFISILWIFNYLSNEGKFDKISHITVGHELLKERKAVYLSYLFSWNGMSNPTLEKVDFIKNDGTIVAIFDEQVLIKPLISKVNFGSLYEEDAIKEGIINKLLPVNGFKPDGEFSLVIRVEQKDYYYDWNNDIDTVRITYKKFGQSHYQNISFDKGIVADNE
jgi:hypothetical protein